MAEQVPLIDVSAEPVSLPLAPATEIFLVAAHCRGGDGRGYWKIHRETNNDEFFTREQAEAKARGLSAQWTDRTILRVRLGAAE